MRARNGVEERHTAPPQPPTAEKALEDARQTKRLRIELSGNSGQMGERERHGKDTNL